MSDSHTNEISLKITVRYPNSCNSVLHVNLRKIQNKCCVSKKHKSLTHDREKQYILQKKKKCWCPKLTSKHGDEENKPVGQLITLELVLTQGILMGPPAHKKKKKSSNTPPIQKLKNTSSKICKFSFHSPHHHTSPKLATG